MNDNVICIEINVFDNIFCLIKPLKLCEVSYNNIKMKNTLSIDFTSTNWDKFENELETQFHTLLIHYLSK